MPNEPKAPLMPDLYAGTKLVPYETRYFHSEGLAEKLGYTEDPKRYYSEETVKALLAAPPLPPEVEGALPPEPEDEYATKHYEIPKVPMYFLPSLFVSGKDEYRLYASGPGRPVEIRPAGTRAALRSRAGERPVDSKDLRAAIALALSLSEEYRQNWHMQTGHSMDHLPPLLQPLRDFLDTLPRPLPATQEGGA